MNINKIIFMAFLMGSCQLSALANACMTEAVAVMGTTENGERLKELKILSKLCKLPKAKATEKAIAKAMNIVKLYGLSRQDDYIVTGSGIHDGKITLQNVRDMAKAVSDLGVAAYKEGGEAQKSLDLLLDYLASQNLYARFPKFKYSNYTDIRKIPNEFLSALSACDNVRKEGIINGVLNLLEWDIVRSGDDAARAWVSSDYLYNVIPYIYICAVMNPNKEQGMKDMETFAHFLDICTMYSPGGKDLLKPDGTSFHHRTHYIGYMYSFRTWVDYMYKLKGTSFRISKPAYERMRKAVISEYMMAVCSENDKNRILANSMAGRHPFYGTPITFTAEALEQLIEIGGDIDGKEYDEVLASYYNAFYKTNKYKGVTPAKLDGYYQFNYSPAGVYRKDNWVAVMRCPTTKFWGGELYNKTNRFGRYQSHGTLEVIYEGGLEATGYPAHKETKSAGWDWNMMPGSTTVHYTDLKSMLPNGNNKDRFDQWSKTTNFAGALSGNDCGLFAAAFDQADTWGGQRFVPTNLNFHKSVLAADGMLFSVGNDISATGDYPEWITATNLFQSVMEGQCKELVVDGKNIGKGNELVVSSNQPACILAPNTTGYYVPAGHDELVIKFQEQESYSSMGIGKENLGKAVVSKAYLNHGVKPFNKNYQFMVIPATDAQRLAKAAAEFETGKLFKVELMQDNLHILKYVPKSLIAYSFFAPASGLTIGNVCGSETELLVLESTTDNRMKLSLCNPNLRPKDLEGKDWISTETDAVVELKGKWQLSGHVEGVSLESKMENTLLKVTLKDGEKVDVMLKK